MPLFFMDAGDEMAALQKLTLRADLGRAKVNSSALGPQALSGRLSSYQKTYPWMNGDTMLSLSAGGIDPVSDVAQVAARQSAVIQTDRTRTPNDPDQTTGVFDMIRANRGERRQRQQKRPLSSQKAGNQPQDPVLKALAGTPWVDKATGLPVRPESEGDRAKFARTMRRIARVHGLKLGAPYWDPEREAVMLLPKSGDPVWAQTGQLHARTGLNQSIEPRRQRQLAQLESRPQTAAENAFVRLSPAERAAFVINAEQGEERKQGSKNPKGFLEVTKAASMPLVQLGGMALNAPLQAVQGTFRNVVADIREDVGRIASGEAPELDIGKLPGPVTQQTDLGLVLGNKGFTLADAGSGFFVAEGSRIQQERLSNELKAGTIGGHVITPGRFFADVVTEPGTKPFNILSGLGDMSVALASDPAAIGLKAAGKAAQLSKTFSMGGVLGLRRATIPEQVNKWLVSDDGAKVVNRLVGMDDPGDILRATNYKLDPDVAVRLADSVDPDEVTSILRPQLGVSLREHPNPANFLPQGKRSMRTLSFTQMPGRWIDLDDGAQAVQQTELFLRNVKAPTETLRQFTSAMARAGDRVERFGVTMAMLSDAKGLLVSKYGVSSPFAKRMTRMFEDTSDDMRKFFVDELGNDVNVWGHKTIIGGVEVDLPGPQLLSETISRAVSLPDARSLRRMTSKYGRLFAKTGGVTRAGKAFRELPGARNLQAAVDDVGQLRAPFALVDWAIDGVWKASVLARLAWPMRVISEEQLRMAAHGADSLFHHPLSYVAWATGKKGGLAVTGEKLEDAWEFQQAMSRGAAGLFRRPADEVGLGFYDLVRKTADDLPRFQRGFGEELVQLHTDPVARMVANAETLDDAKRLFRAMPERQTLSKAGKGHPELLDDAGADLYIDNIQRRINIKTGGNPELLDAIRTGRLRGTAIQQTVGGHTQLSQKFVNQLGDFFDSAPDIVKVEKSATLTRGTDASRMLDRAVDRMFGTLMSKPTNFLSRSPQFRQAYWSRVDELMHQADGGAQQAIRARADKAGIKFQQDIGDVGNLSLDELDVLAKSWALDDTKNLLYDLSQRSQFFDAARLIFPFGEAWREIMTRWFGRGGLIERNPAVVRRGEQSLRALRSPELGELTGAPEFAGEQQGFFYTDPRTGQEMFAIPGSGWITSKILSGTPVPLAGRVAGLNLVGEVWPGFGPLVQVPVGAWMPDKPVFDVAQDVVNPFGKPAGRATDITTWVEQFTPSWFQRYMARDAEGISPEAARENMTAVGAMMRYLATANKDDYDLQTDEGWRKLEAEAKAKAKKFAFVRAAAQFISPSAPSPVWQVKDEFGNLVMASWVAEEYRKMQQADPTTADQRFLEAFGEDMFLTMQSTSVPTAYGLPVTEDGFNWVRDNPHVKEAYPQTYGYFTPQTGEFSVEVWSNQFKTGERELLTPDEFRKAGNTRVAFVKLEQARQRVAADLEAKGLRAPTQGHRDWLRGYEDMLRRQYPGFGEAIPTPRPANTEQAVIELERAVTDPLIKDTPAGKALIKYFGARQRVVDRAKEMDITGWGSANATIGLRGWLRGFAEVLVRDTPEFSQLWDDILSDEMNEEADDIKTLEAVG